MRRISGCILLFLASPAFGEDSSQLSGFQKNLELPAHRSLQSVIADPANTLSPFETDGCSGGMSWSWRVVADLFPDFEEAQGERPPWEFCCVVHDRAYHNAAGAIDAEASFLARLTADNDLQSCVVEKGEAQLAELAARYDQSEDQIRFAYGVIASSMFNAVRFGGAPCSGLPWRWGFGYPGCVPGF